MPRPRRKAAPTLEQYGDAVRQGAALEQPYVSFHNRLHRSGRWAESPDLPRSAGVRRPLKHRALRQKKWRKIRTLALTTTLGQNAERAWGGPPDFFCRNTHDRRTLVGGVHTPSEKPRSGNFLCRCKAPWIQRNGGSLTRKRPSVDSRGRSYTSYSSS